MAVKTIQHLLCEPPVELDVMLPAILNRAFKGEF
jgi:hypothetical protein